MPTVAAIKAAIQDQIAPGNDVEFLRLLTEADMRLLEFVKFRWTRSRVTLDHTDGFVYLPTEFAGVMGAQVGGMPVDIRDEAFEFCAGGVGDIPVNGPGGAMLIDSGTVLYTVEENPMDLEISGSITLYGDPLVFPSVIPQQVADVGGKPAFFFADTNGDEWSASWQFETGVGYFWSIGREGDSVFFRSSEDVATPDLVTQWTPATGQGYDGQLLGTPVVTLINNDVTELRRRYKVTGLLPEGTSIRAWANYAPFSLYDTSSGEPVPQGYSASTRCPSIAALKLATIGILLEEANQIDESRKYFATALQNLSSKEGRERAGARPVINVRKGAGTHRIRNFK